MVSQNISSSDTRKLYYRAGELVNEVLTQSAQQTRLIKADHTCLGVSNGSKLSLTATDHHDSLLWSREAGTKEGQVYCWSPYGSGKATDLLPGFNGERADPLSGAYHLGNGYRAYNPLLMRFNCPDSLSPFGVGGINPYIYCADDPVNHTDPSGHISWQGIMGITVGVLGILLAGVSGGMSVAAAGGITAALEATSVTSLAVSVSGVLSDVTAIASGALEDRNPEKSSILGWVSLSTGLAGLFVGLKQGSALIRNGLTEPEDIQTEMRSIHGQYTGSEETGRSLIHLSDEMIRNISTYLSVEDTRNLRLVNSRFAGAITGADMTRRLEKIMDTIESYQSAPQMMPDMTAIFFDKIGADYGNIARRVIRLSDYARLNATSNQFDEEMISTTYRRIMRDFHSLSPYNPYSSSPTGARGLVFILGQLFRI
jgi:RHS repeat-associated protein